jgi:hypothetical protein
MVIKRPTYDAVNEWGYWPVLLAILANLWLLYLTLRETYP